MKAHEFFFNHGKTWGITETFSWRIVHVSLLGVLIIHICYFRFLWGSISTSETQQDSTQNHIWPKPTPEPPFSKPKWCCQVAFINAKGTKITWFKTPMWRNIFYRNLPQIGDEHKNHHWNHQPPPTVVLVGLPPPKKNNNNSKFSPWKVKRL